LNALNVYFGRRQGLFIVTVERDFYRSRTGDGQPSRSTFADEACAFIPLGFLTKERFDQRIRRYLETARWPEYVAYVLDAKQSPGTGGITYNPFHLVAADDGPPDLVVDRRRRVRANGLDELAQRISDEIEKASRKLNRDYRTEEFGWMLLAVPTRNLDLGRDRDLIFGYSWGDFVRRPVDRAER
jgi:hypothetical protein